MLNLRAQSNIDSGVFDLDCFQPLGFHDKETDQIGDDFCWTNYHFCIKSKKEHIKNITIHFFNIFEAKNIFISTFKQNKSLSLKRGESVLYIPIVKLENINIFIDPCEKMGVDPRKNMGCIVKRVFFSDGEDRLISFIDTDEIPQFKRKTNVNIENYLNSSYENQDYKVKFLDIKKAKNELVFNPCLFEKKKNKYLSCRVDATTPNKSTFSYVKLFKYPSLEEVKINLEPEYKNESIQDCKFFEYKNELILKCVSGVSFSDNYFHEKWIVLDDDFNQKNVIHPVYGGNGASYHLNTCDEKNWTMFELDSKLYFIHKFHPHTVVETNLTGGVISEYITHENDSFLWSYGEIRLSTNPVRVGDCFFSFFHSHIFVEKQRVYFVGWYKFQAKPPFKIVEVSKTPVIRANNSRSNFKKEINEYNPLCVFPLGVILDNNKITMSAGINDQECAIFEFDNLL